METIGIDLAAQDEKTAICTVRWTGGRATVHRPMSGATDRIGEADLLQALRRKAWVGVDAPFGWPKAFVRAISRHARRRPWAEAPSDELRYRLTDRLIREDLKVSPLSVSSDRIGVTAWRCARLLSLARPGEDVVSRTGRDGIVEVYPGAALRCWGFDRRGYKASGGREKRDLQRAKREALLGEIESRVGWLDWANGAREACVDSDDALDALLCALIARAVAVGATRWPITAVEREAAATEGWIHLPRKDSLGELARWRVRKPPG